MIVLYHRSSQLRRVNPITLTKQTPVLQNNVQSSRVTNNNSGACAGLLGLAMALADLTACRLRVRLGHVPHIRLATGRRHPGRLVRGGTPALHCACVSLRVLPPCRHWRRDGGAGQVGGGGCRLRPRRAVLKAWIVGVHCLHRSLLSGEDTVATQQASDAQSEQASDDHYGYHASH